MKMFELTYDRLDELRSMQLLYGCPGLSSYTDSQRSSARDYID
jgi:hypothetical protein